MVGPARVRDPGLKVAVWVLGHASGCVLTGASGGLTRKGLGFRVWGLGFRV